MPQHKAMQAENNGSMSARLALACFGWVGLLCFAYMCHGQTLTECVALLLFRPSPNPTTASCRNALHPFLNGLDSHWLDPGDRQMWQPVSMELLLPTGNVVSVLGTANGRTLRWLRGVWEGDMWVGRKRGPGGKLIGQKGGLSSCGCGFQ